MNATPSPAATPCKVTINPATPTEISRPWLDVPSALQRFRARHPRVEVALRTAASDQLSAHVADGTLDVAFLGLPAAVPPTNVRAHALAHDRHVAVVAADHPLATRTSAVRLRRLARETFVDFLPARASGRAQTDRAFAAAGLDREVAYEVDSADLMARIVRHGLAIALLPSSFAQTLPDLVCIPVVDGPSRIEYLVWSDFNPSPATRALLDVLELDPGAA